MKAFSTAIVGSASAALLVASRFLDFATGVPMVGAVRLGSGTSGVSWAGDTRLAIGILLLIFATTAALRSSRWLGASAWLAGAATGWLAAFVYGGAAWFLQQREMLSAMSIDPANVEFKPGAGAASFFLAFIFSVVLSWMSIRRMSVLEK